MYLKYFPFLYSKDPAPSPTYCHPTRNYWEGILLLRSGVQWEEQRSEVFRCGLREKYNLSLLLSLFFHHLLVEQLAPTPYIHLHNKKLLTKKQAEQLLSKSCKTEPNKPFLAFDECFKYFIIRTQNFET